MGAPGASCLYGCVKDSECGADQICVCGEPVGHCVAAACRSDAECATGFLCKSYDSSNGCGIERFACQTLDDVCGSNEDCAETCDADSGQFQCVMLGCAIGRPFLVDGTERTASLVVRGDWLSTELSLDTRSIPGELRQRAAENWARIGQMEHASVAAFARFALQLLQLGAPPELIEGATQAMADETRHAKLAFAIATRLSSRACGPGPLDVERSLQGTTLTEVVRLVMREGCIGETVAALEAREAAEHAASIELQHALQRIADDETRHAELAWRFVRWALRQQPASVTEVVRAELARAACEIEAPVRPYSADEPALLGLGVVPEGLRRELRRAALLEVIQPCATALLAQTAEPSLEYRVLSA